MGVGLGWNELCEVCACWVDVARVEKRPTQIPFIRDARSELFWKSEGTLGEVVAGSLCGFLGPRRIPRGLVMSWGGSASTRAGFKAAGAVGSSDLSLETAERKTSGGAIGRRSPEEVFGRWG